jgi:nitrite reductase/ring-hydroxylating ferredoxin subunit
MDKRKIYKIKDIDKGNSKKIKVQREYLLLITIMNYEDYLKIHLIKF